MNHWQRVTTPERIDSAGDPGLLELTSLSLDRSAHRAPATSGPSCVTRAGADWLASASIFPASVHALWRHRRASPSVLPCGLAFDVVSTGPLLGRRVLDRLWSTGPGSGPVAVHRGRILLFAAPGTAQRLPALLSWGEWRAPRGGDVATRSGALAETFPSLLCLGQGDYVTIPALTPPDPDDPAGRSRWLVAPDLRHPWLPGPEVLLRACLRSRHHDRRSPHPQSSVRAGRGPAAPGQPIFETADRDAKVYDVTRRR